MRYILGLSALLIVGMTTIANEEECIADLTKILSEVHKRVDPLRHYAADKRVSEFVDYSDRIIGALKESLEAQTCLSQPLSDELLNFEKKQRLMATFIAAALLNAKPLMEYGVFKREQATPEIPSGEAQEEPA